MKGFLPAPASTAPQKDPGIMDGITLACITWEFNRRLPLRVRRVYQPCARELHLLLWGKDGEVRLAVSVDPRLLFLGPVKSHPRYPVVPPSFCQLLRSRLEGLVLLSVRQADRDRYVTLDFTGGPEQDCRAAQLHCDLRGTKGDIAFVDLRTGEVFRLVKSERSSHSKGPPEVFEELASKQDSCTDRTPRPADLADILPSSREPWRIVTGLLPGAGKDLCISLLTECRSDLGRTEHPDPEKLLRLITKTREQVEQRRWKPGIYADASGRPVFHVLPLSHLRMLERIDDPEEASSRYYDLASSHAELETLKRRQTSLVSLLKKKLSSRLDAQERDVAEASVYEEFRSRGEMLYASGKRLPAGFSSVKVMDYYKDPPEEVEIPLDAAKTLEENARSYLDRYKKLRRSYEVLSKSLERTRQALGIVREVEELLNSASSREELVALGEEIRSVALEYDVRLEPKKKVGRQGTEPPRSQAGQRGPRVSSFVIGDYRVFVGGTSRQNDYLVTRLARPGDIWLHARGVPGAHVLLRPPAGITLKNVDPEVLLEAAKIAATRSRAKLARKLDVDYTEAANVRKAPGSAPGFVTYTGEKTLSVHLDASTPLP